MGVFSIWLTILAAAWPGQATQPAVSLGPICVDGEMGFSIRPPADAQLLRHGPDEPGQRPTLFQLVSFPIQRRGWNLAVQVMRTAPGEPIADSAERIVERTVEHLGLTLLDRRPQQVDGRDAVRLSARGPFAGSQIHLLSAVVAATETRCFVVEFSGPAADVAELEATFEAILGNFRVLITSRDEAALRQASQAAVALLPSIVAQGMADRLAPTSYYRLLSDGKDVGYMVVSEQARSVRKAEGVQIVERGWLFESTGDIKRVENDLFVSNDLTQERWVNRVHQIGVATQQRSRGYALTQVEGVRQHDTLLVSHSAGPAPTLSGDKAFELPGDYISQAMIRLLPRFLVDSKTQPLAFTCYDTQGGALLTRRYDPIGWNVIELDGKSVSAYRLEDRLGLTAEPAVMWVDRQGRLLRVRTGPIDMILTDKSRIDLLYETRRAEAEAALTQSIDAARKR
ncbi:MAG TPA: hypothetical protein VMZ31_11320 [Phycisphaerae bacterium]|nr:hypothetical protein [Phycisphaerae bacterium]